MSFEEQVLKYSQLLNRHVIERTSADDVGVVEQLWLDPKSHQVVGFGCKAGLLGRNKRAFAWSQIERIGDNILVNTTPETVDAEKPEGVVTVLGHELCTDAGKEAGKLIDYLLVSKTGSVLNYLFSSSGWRGILDGIYVMSPAAIQSFGTKRIIISEIAALNPELYEEGLHHKIGKAADFAQKDYEKTVDHWENLKQRTQVGKEGLKRGAQQLADELQERAQEMKDKVEDVAEQAKERVTEARSKLMKETPPAAPEIMTTPLDEDDDF